MTQPPSKSTAAEIKKFQPKYSAPFPVEKQTAKPYKEPFTKEKKK